MKVLSQGVAFKVLFKIPRKLAGSFKRSHPVEKISLRLVSRFLAVWWDGEQFWINGGVEPIIAGVHLGVSIVIDHFCYHTNWMTGIFVRNTHL